MMETGSPADTEDTASIDTTPSDASEDTVDVANSQDTDLSNPDTSRCPPSPTGSSVGDTLADITLTACDGTPVSLHSYCGRPLYVNTFAGWCPPCRADAAKAAATYPTLPDNSEWLFVIAERDDGSLPSLAYCEGIKEAYGLTMQVVIDPTGTFPDHIGVSSPNSWHLVFDDAFEMVYRAKYDQDGALETLRGLAP